MRRPQNNAKCTNICTLPPKPESRMADTSSNNCRLCHASSQQASHRSTIISVAVTTSRMSHLSFVTLREAVDTNILAEHHPQRLAVKDVRRKVPACAHRLRTIMYNQICVQLSGNWEYAAKRYRSERVETMPDDPKPTCSPAGFRWSSRQLSTGLTPVA